MNLKERSIDPAYTYQFMPYAQKLAEQQTFAEYFSQLPFYPAERYHIAEKQIRDNWERQTSAGGSRSLDRDLEDLRISFNTIQTQHTVQVTNIELLFLQLYSFWEDIKKDFTVGYCDEIMYVNFINEYAKAVQANKKLNLTNWDKEIFTNEIEKEIKKHLK